MPAGKSLAKISGAAAKEAKISAILITFFIVSAVVCVAIRKFYLLELNRVKLLFEHQLWIREHPGAATLKLLPLATKRLLPRKKMCVAKTRI
jgi:hypothetical protein